MENKTPIKWRALEYEFHKKSVDWFWVVWIMAIALIIVSLLFKNNLFSILIFISAFAISLQATKKPSIVDFEINISGIIIHNKKYLYENLDSYSIYIKKDERPKLILKSKKPFMPFITIPLGDVDIQKLDGFLQDHLEKKDYEESILNKLDKYF